MAEDRIEKVYQIRILPEGVIPTFKPGCESAKASIDLHGHRIYRCSKEDKNCVATIYTKGFGSEPMINSALMKICPNNPTLEARI
jgi:hypothetical protein